jgi:hypothetical protein
MSGEGRFPQACEKFECLYCGEKQNIALARQLQEAAVADAAMGIGGDSNES